MFPNLAAPRVLFLEPWTLRLELGQRSCTDVRTRNSASFNLYKKIQYWRVPRTNYHQLPWSHFKDEWEAYIYIEVCSQLRAEIHFCSSWSHIPSSRKRSMCSTEVALWWSILKTQCYHNNTIANILQCVNSILAAMIKEDTVCLSRSNFMIRLWHFLCNFRMCMHLVHTCTTDSKEASHMDMRVSCQIR